jgi:hypothetical protein
MATDDDDLALPWTTLLETALAYGAAVSQAQGSWSTAPGETAVDLDLGTVRFTTERVTATAPVQVIGTVDTADSSWLWGWDHPSVPEPQSRHAARVRDYGLRHGIAELLTRHIPVGADDPLHYTAVAALLSRAQGLTSVSTGRAEVYMTYGTVTLTAGDGVPRSPEGL